MADANLSASSASSSAAAPVSSSPASATVAAAASAAPVSSDCGTALDKSAAPSTAPVSSANPSSAVDASSEPARIELKADVELIRSTAIILQQQQPPLSPPVCDGPDTSNSRKPILPAKNAQPNRCSSCAIRVGLYGFSCKCGNLFCAKHRYSDLHNCSFDYSQTAINQLKKANPKVVAQKMLDTI